MKGKSYFPDGEEIVMIHHDSKLTEMIDVPLYFGS